MALSMEMFMYLTYPHFAISYEVIIFRQQLCSRLIQSEIVENFRLRTLSRRKPM